MHWRFLLFWCCLGFLSLTTLALAEVWTVQTVALRDFRMAQERIEALRAHGFNAYHEFAMNDGKQYVRVRVGCFSDKVAAQAAARALEQYLVDEAVVVPLSDDAPIDYCVRYDLGFLYPDAWGVWSSEANGVVFWVEVGSRRGFVAYNGRSWQVLQTQAEADALRGSSLLASRNEPVSPLLSVPWSDAVGVSVANWQHDFLQARVADGTRLMIGQGKVVWRSSTAVVVESAAGPVAVTIHPNRD
jgi:hypothetical protein